MEKIQTNQKLSFDEVRKYVLSNLEDIKKICDENKIFCQVNLILGN